MSEPKLISPLLDHFAMGDPISDRKGVRTCPAMNQENDDKYIVKIISTPASPAQLDALLLTGAYTDRAQALEYYKSVAQEIVREADILEKLSSMDGFVGYSGKQIVESEDLSGYDVYLLSPYRKTLERHWSKNAPTHLEALNLGLDLCSALSVCRRSGFLYVATKPENIYMDDEKCFKIGDIGFIPLDSLKWASLPDRYRSAYTAPELSDPLASVNTTVDVYAVGLILYQIFNGGQLPDPSCTELPAPEFADYEMAEIILKACAKNPEDRYQDPAEMGQALVGYMQRNGAHDTPVTPPSVFVNEEESAIDEAEEETGTDVVAPVEIAETVSEELPDETLPEADTDVDGDYTQLSLEVSDMLNQADELIAHTAPDPVVPPEFVEVQLPEPENIEETVETECAETDDASESEAEPENLQEELEEAEMLQQIAATVSGEDEEQAEEQEKYEAEDYGIIDYEPKKKSHWVRNTLLILLALCLAAGGFLFYKMYYLQQIDSLNLYGEDFTLTVHVNTKANEELLNVVCYDTYGNLLQSPVVAGKAYFEDLAPDCAYTVKVLISGFHDLTGQIAASYATPQLTTIAQLSAVTGTEDGSAVIHFNIEGPDADNWIIRRSAQDEENAEFTFSGHSYTMTGLTVGKEYTFELLPGEERQIAGNTKITYTAAKVVNAENAAVTSFIDGKLTVTWGAPKDATVDSWTVHCFNEKGYDVTLTVNTLTATFENVVMSDPYTVEITAAGMSTGPRLYIPENAVTISDFAVTKVNSTGMTLTWKNGTNPPANGWILQYSIDGSAVKEVKSTSADSVQLTPYIPDCTYSFTLLTGDSMDVVGGKLTYEAKKASDFSGYTVKRSNMNFKMVRTPSKSNWTKSDLGSHDYTTTFKSIQKASFLVSINKTYGVSSNKIFITYVIRDTQGNVVNFSTQETKWKNMWNKGYGEFDLPELPKDAGNYTVSVYFNDMIAGQQNFKIKN